MRITLDKGSAFYYLSNRELDLDDPFENLQEKPQSSKFPINLNFGSAELPLPLRSVSFQFSGLDRQYCGVASVFSSRALPSQGLAAALGKSFSQESTYRWGSIRPSSIEGYIYEHDSTRPSFAVDVTKNDSNKKLPVFLIYMGLNGANARPLDKESVFIEELNSFAQVTSLFVKACLSLYKPQKLKNVTPAVVPSSLELSCIQVKYE